MVSGSKAAVEAAAAETARRGARAVMLPVSAPFHCALMTPAAEAMEEALAKTELGEPHIPVVANVTAEAVQDADAIRRLLVQQVTGMVRWRESVLYMKGQDVDTLVEIGAGRVLTGLARRIDRDINAVSIQAPADIEKFIGSL